MTLAQNDAKGHLLSIVVPCFNEQEALPFILKCPKSQLKLKKDFLFPDV
jgi:glycosyltransferase involved in cell wall biosynthesis